MNQKLKNLLYLIIPTSLIALILSFFLNTQIIIIIMCFVIIIGADILFKKRLRKELIIALLFALIITSYYNYEYQEYNIKIGKINLYPLICWTTALIILKEIENGISHKNKKIITITLYYSSLLILEYFFYHYLNVRLNSNYPGLFGLNLLHGPIGMKTFYLSIGPIYLYIIDFLGIKKEKNPTKK